MLSKTQNQHSNEGAIAIQAGGDITVTTGISYLEARNIAIDIFNANFYKLAGAAAELAAARANEITEKFLLKLQRDAPIGLEKSRDPDFQYALFTVQKEFARNGDKDLGDLLVDLLVDRSKQDHRDILQIVLNEALSTAPKLTESQLAALAIVFTFKYTQNRRVLDHNKLGEYFDTHVAPFVSKIVTNEACYQHLEFCGCGSVNLGGVSLERAIGTTYQGLFLKGFDKEEVANRGVSIGLDSKVFIPSLNDSSKIQVNALNEEDLKARFEHSISPEDRKKISELFDTAKMSESEIRDKCVSVRPYMSDLFHKWSESPLKSLTLTSVGIAIGHANVKRLVGEFSNLSIWIN